MNLAPFSYFGGKYRLLPNLIKYIPQGLGCYVEPFFGSGTLFFSAPRWAKNEIVNDWNRDIYNFFCVLRARYPSLKRLLHYTPYDVQTFSQAKRIIKEKKAAPVYRAWALYVTVQMSIMNNRRSFSRGIVDKNKPREFQEIVKRLEYCTERLKDVLIENEDAAKIIRRYDSPRTFFYLDPPYLNVKNQSSMEASYHRIIPDEQSHKDLLSIAIEAKGFVLVSNYHNPLYDDMLKDWHIEEIKINVITTSGDRRKRGKVQEVTEVLWSNQKCYDAMIRQPYLFDWSGYYAT